MNWILYTANSIMFFLYTQESNYFYYMFHKKIEHKKRFYILLILQIIGSIMYLLFKMNNPAMSSAIAYFIYIISCLVYDDSLKDRLLYIFFLIAIFICGEMLASSFSMIFFSLFLNVKDVFLDTLLKTNPLYYTVGLLCCIVCVFMVIKYIQTLSKHMSIEQMKENIKTCFLPLVLVFFSVNFIYTANKNNFYIIVMMSFLIVLLAILMIFRGIHRYQKLQKESIENKARQELTTMQIEKMKSIDSYYKKTRRKHHDFKNHCIIALKMLDEQDEEVREYLLSMKEYYRKGG